MDERQMARALGLVLEPGRRGVHKTGKVGGIEVRLAVRRTSCGVVYGGLLKYTQVYTTVSALEAEILAKRKAREEGYAVWHVLEIVRD